MDMVIVGHGPSLIHSNIGTKIDEFFFVSRVNRGWNIKGMRKNLEYVLGYGTKCNAVCYPIPENIERIFVHNVHEIWITSNRNNRWPYTAQWHKDLKSLENQFTVPIKSAFTASVYWMGRYKKRSSQYTDKRAMSTGMNALIIAMENYRPTRITLAGFDNMRYGKPSKPDTMGKDHPHPPDVEQTIMNEISEFYECTILHIP